MEKTAELAGFCAAHGIWTISDTDGMVPFLIHEMPNGERGLTRYLHEDSAEGARAAQEELQANPEGWQHAALVADAFIHLEAAGKMDALIIEAVEYGATPWSFTMAVPYRPQSDPQGFAVHRPKFFEITGLDDPDLDTLAGSFFTGVDSHEDAAPVWNAHLDESI